MTTVGRAVATTTLDGAALRRELVAAATTALVLVPQAMGYALLAGLPPAAGLRAATLPLFAYAGLGSSPAVAVGPVAMDALLAGAALTAVGAEGTSRVALAALLALFVGGLQIAMGALRLGRLTELVSMPVLLGFTAAAAVIIALTQVPAILGVAPTSASALAPLVRHVLAEAPSARAPIVGVGVVSIASMAALERLAPKVPRAPLVLLVTSLLVALVPALAAVPVVGEVPRTPPSGAWLSLDVDTDVVLGLLPYAATIALVAFVESYAVAKRFAATCAAEPQPSRELVALGASNVVSACVSGMPIAGGLSRSAVQVRAGARSRVTGALVGAFVLVLALAAAPLLARVPRAALAGVVLVSAIGLVDRAAIARLRTVKPTDLVFTVVTIVATLGLGFGFGIAVGVVASIAGYVRSTTRPHVAVLGRIPGTTAYRNVDRFPEAVPIPGLLLVRIDAELYFGNATFLRETIDRLVEARGDVRAIVLDASGVNQLDASAEAELAALVDRYERLGVCFALASVKGPVRDVLRASGLWQRIGDDKLFLDIHAAAERCRLMTGGAT